MKTNVYSPLLLLPSILPFLVLYSRKQTKIILFLPTWLRDVNCNLITLANIYKSLEKNRYKIKWSEIPQRTE